MIITFSLQMITGIFLLTAYSGSTQTAWESVYYIQEQMTLGWLVRGIHHFAAQAMTVLLAFIPYLLLRGRCRHCRQGRENLCRRMVFLGSASKFPHVQGGFREVFVVEEAKPVGDLIRAAAGADKALIADVRVFDVYRGKGVDEGFKSVALEVVIQPREATLAEAEIEALTAKVVAAVEKQGGRLRA